MSTIKPTFIAKDGGNLPDYIVNQSGPPATPLPPDPWPMSLVPLKLLAQTGDKGLGDIVARTVGPVGGDAFKAWWLKTFGVPCGCDGRQEWLNAKYPL